MHRPGRIGVGFSKESRYRPRKISALVISWYPLILGSAASSGYWSISFTTMSLSLPVVEA